MVNITEQDKNINISFFLHAQDTMNHMYNAKSAADRGTLYHIRNKFHHRSAKKHVMAAVEHVQHLIDFTTDGLICILAEKLLPANAMDPDGSFQIDGDPKVSM